MSATGSLRVRVFTSRAQLPVEGATVVVTKHGESGKYDVLSIQTTDSSGNTRQILVETPELQESTEPYGVIPPFAQCDIWVEHPDFELMMIEDAQVFPQVESLQMVDLNPLRLGAPWSRYPNVSNVPKQDL